MTKHEADDKPERTTNAAASGNSMVFVGSAVNILHFDCGDADTADFLNAVAFMKKLTGEQKGESNTNRGEDNNGIHRQLQH